MVTSSEKPFLVGRNATPARLLFLVLLCSLLLCGPGCPKSDNHYAVNLPVYNALFSSTVAGVPNALADLKPVKVSFFIGPKEPGSAVPQREESINPELSRDLLVTLSCLFCNDDKLQKQGMTFDPREKRSSKADFTLVPNLQLIRNQSGRGDLVFQVTGATDGVLYDNVVVPIAVLGGLQPSSNTNTIPKARPSLHIAERPPDSRNIDLTITCFEGLSKTVSIQFNATDPELNKRFAKHGTSNGKLVTFDTGLGSSTLATLVANDYATLVAVVENNAALQQTLKGDPNHIATLTNSNNSLVDGDEKKLLDTFHSMGKDLYRRIFLVNPTLAALSEELDNYKRADRPLRIRIETQDVVIPWQFLHPLQGNMDPESFWGFRYELIIDPQGTQADGGYPGLSKYTNGPLIFAKYQADQSDSLEDQEVATLGDLQYDYLKTELTSNVLKADSRQGFMDAMKQHLQEVQMIIAFTHAENGTILQSLPGGEFAAVASVSGPKLWFNKGQALRAIDLDSLPSDFQMAVITMSQHPLVLLNGCETAGGGFFSTKDLSFPAIFLRFGARGVIATESPVWEMFGYYFGKSLIANLKVGQPASTALLNARKEWLHTSKNPLGLLYSYYGGVDASIAFPLVPPTLERNN
jgi:hypothetical protein